ncbi:Histone-lysine N-methyltransferase [Phytophthora megakarya]|uniref:Histone-lysine N-methyltransferase n=1 Tax=Phytophthora megakarya TaxID=4795 RepID=A0A225WQR0_9STRA|nr:Histone-lysine N-methyltransferase [Phytophthora megakarya]
MHFACLVCEQVVVPPPAAEAVDSVRQSVRTEDKSNPLTILENRSFPACTGAISTEKPFETMKPRTDSVHVARCCVCGGIYHTSCLLQLGDAQEQPFTCLKCRSKTEKLTEKEKKVVDDDELPILVPALAFPYVRRPRKVEKDGKVISTGDVLVEMKAKENGELLQSEDNNWRVFSTAVEVCTTCRQVQIAAEDRGRCLKCHDKRLHRRCVEHYQAEHGAEVKKKRVYRGTGKKRRRSSTVTLEWCAPCIVENDKHAKQLVDGSIETRTIALLLNDDNMADDEVQWWKECYICKGHFCMQEFCDPQTTDAKLDRILANVPVDHDESDWYCGHCAPIARSLALVTVVICDGCDGDPQEIVTVLLCDSCDREFDFSSICPPLKNVPEGDWFCSDCVAGVNGSTPSSGTGSLIAPLIPLTLLICDLCDGEFDMNALDPPLIEIPSGDWFCPGCTSTHNAQDEKKKKVGRPKRRQVNKRQSSVQAHPTPGSTNDGEKTSKKRKESLGGPPVSDGSAVVIQPTSHHASSTASVDGSAGPRMLIPKPITLVSSSVGLRNEFDGVKKTSCWSYTNPTVIVADSDDNFSANTIDDLEESGILIICDICYGEFKMTDVLGTDDANTVPARPWVCKPCLRALKRGRKKKPRFSRQMILEMQVYGRLLRATAAKVADIDAVIRLGTPPNSREERRRMYELVGKSVGVFLQWDKQWVMGRVMAFHATHPLMHHTIRFDDGVVASLPLYAFPLVIGTRTMLYVKVPALQNKWWPAQVLQLNVLAQNLLLPTHDEVVGARTYFRLVRIFASNVEHVETTQYVSCWVPKYLCRSMKNFVPPPSGNPAMAKGMDNTGQMLSNSVKHVGYEAHAEIERLDRVFQVLLAGFRRTMSTVPLKVPVVPAKPLKSTKRVSRNSDVSERCAQIAEAMVGKMIKVTFVGSCDQLVLGIYEVRKFDKDSNKHIIVSQSDMNDADSEIMIDLLRSTDDTVYHLEDAKDFSELAIMLELSGSDVGGGIPGEFHSKELLEKAIIREAGVVRDNTTSITANDDREGSHMCSYCLLDPEECKSDIGTLEAVNNHENEEELVVCSKCDKRFHTTCCDPPHAPISLVNPEDGVMLVSDLKIPFVCSDCTSCAGCHCLQKDDTERENLNPQWSQWRLPLRAAALCTKCIPYYKANRFCGVCNLVLDGEELATSVDLLTCSTCHHWIHADCEPDPHPTFHSISNTGDFALDVITDASENQSNELGPGSHTTATVTSTHREANTDSLSSLRITVGSLSPSEEREILSNGKPTFRDDGAFKTTKQIEEDFALFLRFGAGYDPKVLHNYECMTCRKVRMLHVLHRLGVEDKLDLFKDPVTEAIAPTYFDIIKSPMDLSTMRQKILDDEYLNVNFRTFRDDFELMCLNAVTFNSKERDFLIWREAWRFYGQGQRIFRQTAPKARMKQRGGRHYDALLVAAKRQLPNNSALAGKSQSNGDFLENGEGGDNEDDDELDDDEEGDNGSEVGSEACSRGGGPQEKISTSNGMPRSLAAEATSVSENGSKSNMPDSTRKTQRCETIRDIVPTASANGTSLVVSTTPTDRRIVTNDALVFQTKLRIGNSTSQVPLFLLMQSRTSAHTYCWLDMCAVCGSAGLQNEFIFCVDCGEGFHSFCIPGMNGTRVEDINQIRAYWRCPNCKMCEICGQPGDVCFPDSNSGRLPANAGNVDGPAPAAQVNGAELTIPNELSSGEPLLLCEHCDRGYHGSCFVPAIKLPSNSKRRDGTSSIPSIYCASCVTCTSCKDTKSNIIEHLHTETAKKDNIAALERAYSYEQTKCLHCYNRKEREAQALKERTRLLTEVWTIAARNNKKDAEKCPLCRRKWDADLEELMQCDACERWVHPPCDELLKTDPKRYQILVSDSSAVYVCAACRPQEREHLTHNIPDGEGWRCQVLIADIQRKRLQCESSWNETHMQLEQIERWKRLADHTPVYLYVLRLGEECLHTFAYRSLNFQSDWYRFSKHQELDSTGVVLPEWLLRKANRYMRFKRYMRGPRAAARRRERKTQSFYSKQTVGLNTRKDASAICTIVSEAASCAALLACVHLLYGWRPLSEVVIHLLSSDEVGGTEYRKLNEPLLKRLRSGESVDGEEPKPRLKLEEEITAIKEQYDRRVAKRHLVHKPSSDLAVFGSGVVAANTAASPTVETNEKSDTSKQTNSEPSSMPSVTPESVKPTSEVSVDTPAPSSHVSAHRSRRPQAQMTIATPLRGWPTRTDKNDGESIVAFEDTRFCALCFMIGDNTACGRLLYTESEAWVHVNCAIWSMEVYEDVSGVLHKCSKAKHRSRLIRCDACGLMGATIGCSIARCTTHFHFPCAVDAGVAFLPNGETCCPFAPHLDIVARRLEVTNGVPLTISATPEVYSQPALANGANDAVNVSNNSASSTIVDGQKNSDLYPTSPAEESERKGGDDLQDVSDTGSKTSVSENATEASATPDSAAMEAETFSVVDAKEKNIAEPLQGEKGSAESPQTEKTKLSGGHQDAAVISQKQTQHVLPVINPRPEPRRRLFSDPPLVNVSDIKKKKRAELKRGIKPRPMCYRVGALTVHSLGHIFVGNGSFHTRTAIYPLGFRSTRIFWSTRQLATRCLYECAISNTEIEDRRAQRLKKLENGEVDIAEAEDSGYDQQRRRPRAIFKITASDDRERPIIASSPEDALIELRSRVVSLYEEQRGFFASPRNGDQSLGNAMVETERNPFLKRSSWFSFALSGDYFFGFGLPEISRHIEELPYAATTAVSRRAIVRKLQQQQQRQGQSPLAGSAAAMWGSGSRKRNHDTMEQSAANAAEVISAMIDGEEDEHPYEFAHELPSAEVFQTAERVMEQLVRAEQRARQSSGCARADGFEGNRLFGAPKKAKIMPRRQALNKEATNEPVPGAANGNGASGNSNSGGVAMDIEHLPITMQYRELRRRPFDERMLVRKSSIHGYGLFLKEPVSEGQMIVEYQGQMICQAVADERERRYEEQGIGSCYMFRLDEKTIIDATRCGNLARFINHSCDPKAFARIVSVEGGEKKIVIFAKRPIAVGDEVTYDYKFPIEDEAIRCDCNAPNCIGRMN